MVTTCKPAALRRTAIHSKGSKEPISGPGGQRITVGPCASPARWIMTGRAPPLMGTLATSPVAMIGPSSLGIMEGVSER